MRGVVTCARLEIVFRALLDAGERGITFALIHRRDLKDVCHLTFQDPMSQESGKLQMIHNTLLRLPIIKLTLQKKSRPFCLENERQKN